MIVKLIAATAFHDVQAMQDAGYNFDHQDYGVPSVADELAEFAGRLCYLSWSRPNPGTRRNSDYLANIIEQQHYSVLEHATAVFYVADVSRSFSHELVRHRHLSFSQLSQRFVDEKNATMIIPPGFADMMAVIAQFGSTTTALLEMYEQIVERLLEAGLTRKQAREAARAVLPNATETRLVVSGNLRAWRDVIRRRIDPAADAEMQLFAHAALKHLKRIAPGCFQDFTS